MSLLGSHTLVDARTGRKVSNALTLTYRSDAQGPIAVGRQGGNKLGILLGFKNGGSGDHVLRDGEGIERLVVCSRNEGPTTITDPAGAVVGAITRGDRGTITDAGGAILATLTDDPAPGASDTWPLLINGPDGARLGAFVIVRSTAYYSLADDVFDHVLGLETHTAAPLPIPIVGFQLRLDAPAPQPLGDLLLAAGADVCFGLSGLTPGMRS